MALTAERAVGTTPLDSLTSALVDANDRLLGLLALITDEAPSSLDLEVLIDAIVERAAPILGFDELVVTGATTYSWGEAPDDAAGQWQTSLPLADLPDADIRVRRATSRFDTGDAKLLSAVAKLLANAITTSEMHRVALDQAMLAKEHATAARITSAALPRPDAVPIVDGVSLFADLVPARTTGGDLYAWTEIDGDLWFALGDVSGKGLPAAVQMSMITSAIDAAFAQHHHEGPDAALSAVNRWVHRRLCDSAMFVTLALGHWSGTTNQLRIANAGHSPIVFRRHPKIQRIEASAPPIGVLEGIPTTATVLDTRPGDLLVIATDGFTEQENVAGEMFGEERFETAVARAKGDATAVGSLLLDQLADYDAGRDQSDDRTLMVLHFS